MTWSWYKTAECLLSQTCTCLVRWLHDPCCPRAYIAHYAVACMTHALTLWTGRGTNLPVHGGVPVADHVQRLVMMPLLAPLPRQHAPSVRCACCQAQQHNAPHHPSGYCPSRRTAARRSAASLSHRAGRALLIQRCQGQRRAAWGCSDHLQPSRDLPTQPWIACMPNAPLSSACVSPLHDN